MYKTTIKIDGMACGPLQSMQLYAIASGGFLGGAASSTPRGTLPSKKHRCKATFCGRDCRAPLRAVPPLRIMARFLVMIDLF